MSKRKRITLIGKEVPKDLDLWPGDEVVLLSPIMARVLDKRTYTVDSLGTLKEVH